MFEYPDLPESVVEIAWRAMQAHPGDRKAQIEQAESEARKLVEFERMIAGPMITRGFGTMIDELR